MGNGINFVLTADGQTAAFALEELKKYYFLLEAKAPDGFVVTLGLLDRTDEYIDSIEIDVGKNGGSLKGSNPRSLLYAVYRYVEALGVRFIRHGFMRQIHKRQVLILLS